MYTSDTVAWHMLQAKMISARLNASSLRFVDDDAIGAIAYQFQMRRDECVGDKRSRGEVEALARFDVFLLEGEVATHRSCHERISLNLLLISSPYLQQF